MSTTPETIVEYRWPNDTSWSRVKVADSSASATTAAETMPGQCPNAFYEVTVRTFRYLFSGCREGVSNTVVSLQGAIGPLRETCINNRWRVELASIKEDGSIRYWKFVREGCFCTQAKASPQIIDIVQTSTATCPTNACRFTVLDSQGAIVFSDIREGGCPEWRIEGGCPEGTIKCGDCCLDCGNYLGDVRSLVSQVKQLTGQPLNVTQG